MRRKKPIPADTAITSATPATHQISLRLGPEMHAQVERCCADAAFHGGITCSRPDLLHKALWTYLRAWEAETSR